MVQWEMDMRLKLRSWGQRYASTLIPYMSTICASNQSPLTKRYYGPQEPLKLRSVFSARHNFQGTKIWNAYNDNGDIIHREQICEITYQND